MYKLPTCDIFISAFNEGINLSNLIDSLKKQNFTSFKLNKIYAISDGSIDDTFSLSAHQKSKNISINQSLKRKGKNDQMNNYFKKTEADVLVVLDADIVINDKNFIQKLIHPIINNFDLTSCHVDNLTTSTIIDKALETNLKLIYKIFGKYKKGDNIFTCRGVARAFSRSLYKQIQFPPIVGEDAYSYLFCKCNNFKYKYVNNAISYIKLPNSLNDHLKQSLRFTQSKKEMYKFFNKITVNDSYYIPKSILLLELIKSAKNNFMSNFVYILINIVSRVMSLTYNKSSDLWDIALSSKSI